MEKITSELIAEKLSKKLSASEIESLGKRELNEKITDAVNQALLEVEKEVHQAAQFSEKITTTTDSKLDALKIFWYAIGASFIVNVFASTLLQLLSQVVPVFSSSAYEVLILLVCLLFLGLLYIGMATEIIKFWKESLHTNKIVYRVFTEGNSNNDPAVEASARHSEVS